MPSLSGQTTQSQKRGLLSQQQAAPPLCCKDGQRPPTRLPKSGLSRSSGLAHFLHILAVSQSS